MTPRTVLSIGNFDGVHVGHAALIRRARALADTPGSPVRGRVIALAFDPHPLTKLRPAVAPARLSRFERRAELLSIAGADEVVQLRPDQQTLSRSPAEFASWLVDTFSPAFIVEGSDFHFGSGRGGNVRTLADLGASMPEAKRFLVDIVPPVEVALDDQLIVTASSSITRWLVQGGRVRDAAAVLGRPHEIDGVVTSGDQRGRTIGFPTANLFQAADEVLLPADGVYAAIASLPDGPTCAAAVNIGTRPTFNGLERRVEALLLDDAGVARREMPIGDYGWRLRLGFVAWLRDQVKFSGVEALKQQLARDLCRAGDAVRRWDVRERATSEGVAASDRVGVLTVSAGA